MYPRRITYQDRAYAHVFFRCHNREHLLAPRLVKEYLLKLWAKYKARYKVEIFDFIIMDNHAHLLVRAPTSEHLARFMRQTNSLLAKFTNKFHGRDSQAIRERYRSPIISNMNYFQKCQQYIWLNRHKVDQSQPEYDVFCSASWRLNMKRVLGVLKPNAKEFPLLRRLLNPYSEITMGRMPDTKRYVRDLLSMALGSVSAFTSDIYENAHTIGDKLAINFRSELMRAFRRENVAGFV